MAIDFSEVLAEVKKGNAEQAIRDADALKKQEIADSKALKSYSDGQKKFEASRQKLADDTEVNALGREELIKAEHTFEFSVGYIVGINRALELLKKEEIEDA